MLQAHPSATVLAAYDINDVANQVYAHNFGHAPLAIDVCTLTAAQLDAHAADVWLLSPPCQPYTRRGLQLQSSDTRSVGFLGILKQLQAMKNPPKYILLENVVGFEASDTRDILCDVLKQCNFSLQEFLLSPCQLGIPYSRPRYFCIAKRSSTNINGGNNSPFQLENLADGIPFTIPPSQLLSKSLELVIQEKGKDDTGGESGGHGGDKVSLGSFLAEKMPENSTANTNTTNTHLICSSTSLQDLYLSKEILIKHGWCLDLVGLDSTRVNCITKAYSHFLKGSGSVLATENADMIPEILERFPVDGILVQQQESNDTKIEAFVESLEQLKLRFLSPGEVAALHSFPPAPLFGFPDGISLRQRYQLLGNSLSVAIVADLLNYLFSDF